MNTITIVIPWFGRDTAGGAETQAHQLAQAIHALGVPVEVWATTGRDAFAPPEPYYSEGPDELDGVPVRRFALTLPHADPYVPPAVARRGLHTQLPAFPDHELRLLASLVSSDALLEAIAAEGLSRRFLFVLYPFPTSFWGALLAGERAHLLPCLHDEPYARYSTVRWLFRHARRALANSPAERDLALRLYDLPPDRVIAAGEGIDLTARGDGAAFRARRGLHGPLLMYAGRDPIELPPALGAIVLDLCDVSVQERQDAYAAADLFVHPSVHESFSIVLMEAWLQGTPALVHADCAVTRQAAEASGGGLAFHDFGEFAAALDMLLADAELRRELGRRGHEFVLATCDWADVARKTVEAILN